MIVGFRMQFTFKKANSLKNEDIQTFSYNEFQDWLTN